MPLADLSSVRHQVRRRAHHADVMGGASAAHMVTRLRRSSCRGSSTPLEASAALPWARRPSPPSCA